MDFALTRALTLVTDGTAPLVIAFWTIVPAMFAGPLAGLGAFARMVLTAAMLAPAVLVARTIRPLLPATRMLGLF